MQEVIVQLPSSSRVKEGWEKKEEEEELTDDSSKDEMGQHECGNEVCWSIDEGDSLFLTEGQEDRDSPHK